MQKGLRHDVECSTRCVPAANNFTATGTLADVLTQSSRCAAAQPASDYQPFVVKKSGIVIEDTELWDSQILNLCIFVKHQQN